MGLRTRAIVIGYFDAILQILNLIVVLGLSALVLMEVDDEEFKEAETILRMFKLLSGMSFVIHLVLLWAAINLIKSTFRKLEVEKSHMLARTWCRIQKTILIIYSLCFLIAMVKMDSKTPLNFATWVVSITIRALFLVIVDEYVMDMKTSIEKSNPPLVVATVETVDTRITSV